MKRTLPDLDVYYQALAAEYRFWMDESDIAQHAPPVASRRSVAGLGLNRYWDANTRPRPEGFWEDLNTCLEAGCPPDSPEAQACCRHIRAAAESGWDFSSRWLLRDHDGRYRLKSIRTTDVLPVDLNALLYHLEVRLAGWAERTGQAAQHTLYTAATKQRREALLQHFWDEERGWFFDCTVADQQKTDIWSLAGAYPLFCEVLDRSQDWHKIERMAANIESRFLKPGGVVTTLTHTGQQWDLPNGWAPLQWVTVAGLVNYGFHDLARTIARRFVDLAQSVYERTGRMMEKYDVCDLSKEAGGGEYPNQDGFGWTNAVVKGFLEYLNGNIFWL